MWPRCNSAHVKISQLNTITSLRPSANGPTSKGFNPSAMTSSSRFCGFCVMRVATSSIALKKIKCT